MVEPSPGRPNRHAAKRRRARFVELRARGVTLEESLAELGCKPLTLIRWLDDPGLPAAVEAMRAALGLDDEERAAA